MITGNTTLIAHIGYPTHSFKSPMIYNPYFEAEGIDAVVAPMSCRAEDFSALLRPLFQLTNLRGALITMPHKVTVLGMLDDASTTAKIAGSCNAVLRRPDGSLAGDMFDGEGFVRGMLRKGRAAKGARALVVGSGGVGCAIAASLAAAGVAHLSLFDARPAAAQALRKRLAQHYPGLSLSTGSNDPAGFDIVVNATPLGMEDGDPLPFDADRLDQDSFVGEVVLKEAMTPLLRAAAAKGCGYQIGLDMLFEQIPAYLEFFGFPTTTPERLRALAG